MWWQGVRRVIQDRDIALCSGHDHLFHTNKIKLQRAAAPAQLHLPFLFCPWEHT